MEFLMYCLLRHLVHVVPMHVNSLCTFVHGVSYHLLLLPLDFMLVLNYLFSRLEQSGRSHVASVEIKKENVACEK